MAVVIDRLLMAKFLDRSASKPFAWGQNDCLLDVADWLDAAAGFAVAREWRGRYSSQEECDALLGASGGLVEAITAAAARLGIETTDRPVPGDVALVRVDGKPMGAIMMLSGRWRMRAEGGFVTSREPEVVIAWSVPCRRL